MSIQSLLDYISVTPDIRQQGKVKHKLSAILFLTVCAVIAGADEWQEIEDFGHERLEWLKKYGDFDNGIPVDDTIARVVSNMTVWPLKRCLLNGCRSAMKSLMVKL